MREEIKNQMGIPRTEPRAHRNSTPSGSCGPSQHLYTLAIADCDSYTRFKLEHC